MFSHITHGTSFHRLTERISLHALAVFIACFCVLSLNTARAQTFTDTGFVTETVTTLPVYKPTGLTFAPDGRMFIWQENGIVRIYKNGVLLTTPFLNIQSRVNTVNDRGMLGFALDPNFATNGYVYLAYTYEPNGNPNDAAPKTNRLTRMQVDPANPDVVLPNSEVVLLGSIGTAPCSNYPDGSDCIGSDSDSHSVGAIKFAPDGKMFVSFGDGASYSYADRLALRAQNLNRYEGKLLRLNRDGTAPSDNPFYDGTNSARSKIYSYGLRNPYRFAVHPTTGEPYIGDVGWGDWEEQNRGRGANFGWACFEGNDPQPAYQANFPAECGSVSAASVTKPLYTYPRNSGAATIGGTFYTGVQFPTQYRSNYFFADYVQDWIRRMTLDSNGNVVSVQNFATGLNGIVTLEQGPDGALYYISLPTGQIRRIRFGNVPVAVASANPTNGVAPLPVSFSSNGSNNPAGGSITYRWEFGDGAISTEANPSHTYAYAGNYTARLTVTNQANSSSTATVNITVTGTVNNPPTATILAPTDGTSFAPGQTVTFRGSAYDPNESLPASSMSWQILLHHDDHIHPYTTATGESGSFVIQDHGTGSFYYEIILTVTDSGGLTDTKRVIANITTSSTTTYLSDLTWTYMTNGWGPAERDRSNGEDLQGDGLTITLTGVTYSKGLGVHANSEIRYNLAGQYTTFACDIGVDDEVTSLESSVVFEIWADGVKLYDSGVMTANTATKNISVNVSGKQELRLIVKDAADGNAYDHADWANARLLRSSTNAPPTVSLTSPTNGATFTAPANITLTANAADSDGTIAKVEFYGGTTLIGTDTTAPYSFAWSNVAAGTYTLTAKAFDNAGLSTTSSAVSITVNAAPPASAGSGTGTGLRGEYFDNSNFTSSKLVRTDATVNFNWGTGSPAAGIGADTFSARWTGQIEPRYSETYTFYTISDEGVRLWINDQLIINNWTSHTSTENQGSITLVGGQRYNIKLEYYENTGSAAIQLLWSSANQLREIVPKSRLYPGTGSTTYLSDLTWTYMTNGWGPVERDRSNGEDLQGDGRTITLNGVAYTKGLGTHALSEVRYNLAGQYTTFASDIGVDDEVTSPESSVVFEVWADGVKLYDSGIMSANTATKNVSVNVSGKQELRLIVKDAGDGNAYDHADWANARLIR